MILGFGSTEEGERQKIKNALLAAAMRGEDLYNVSKTWNAERAKYDKMSRAEAPERYTTFHVYDGTIHYQHINRNYPFSDDGWGMMTVEEPILATAGKAE